jgi:2-(1,2-epoxy-1,2-dihydrophenyl)acetyl-CoA isomerase
MPASLAPVEGLRVEIADGVMTVTLDRPEHRNAVTQEMITGLGAAIALAEKDDAVGCLVLTGAGGAFSAGGDVKNMARRNADAGSIDHVGRMNQQRRDHRAVSARLHQMAKPTIAALPGAAAGAGFSLALACDFRIAADTAFMTTAFAKVGLSGDYGGTWFATRIVGPAKARELYLLADRVDMQEAQRLGLVNWVVPAAELETRTQALARRLAAGPRVAYALLKDNLDKAIDLPLLACLDNESVNMAAARMTEDHREAAKAFAEKRSPVFKGR